MNAVMVNTRIIDTGEIFMDAPLLPEKARFATKTPGYPGCSMGR
jgi:hypothetical protein